MSQHLENADDAMTAITITVDSLENSTGVNNINPLYTPAETCQTAPAVDGVAAQVAPQEVRQAIAPGRKKCCRCCYRRFGQVKKGCGRWFEQANKKYWRTFLVAKVFNAMLNVSLYFLDIYTDVVLLITFLNHGWFWSSVGSITFIALPYLVAMYGIVRTRKQALKDYVDWSDIDWFGGL